MVLKKSAYRCFLIFLLLTVIALAFVGLHRHIQAEKSLSGKISGTWFKQPIAMPAFSLQESGGKLFSNINFNDHITLLFFGFSNCPYVCPTTLSELNVMMDHLKKAHVTPLPQVALISVDPARDSVKRMHEYVSAFNPAFLGLRAPLQQIKHLTHEMHVSFSKVVETGQLAGRYTITHTPNIFVIGPHGKLRAKLSYPTSISSLSHDYQSILNHIKKTDHLL